MCSSTNFRTPIRFRRKSCCCSPPTIRPTRLAPRHARAGLFRQRPQQAIYRFRRADVETYQRGPGYLLVARVRGLRTFAPAFARRRHLQRVINAAFEPVMDGTARRFRRSTWRSPPTGRNHLGQPWWSSCRCPSLTASGGRRLRDREVVAGGRRRIRALAPDRERPDDYRTDDA